MKVNVGIWDILSRVIVFLLFCAGLCGLICWYLPLFGDNQRYRRQILELDIRIQEQEKQGKELKAAIEALQNDPRTLERLARERLGLARSNETVIRFEPVTAAIPRIH